MVWLNMRAYGERSATFWIFEESLASVKLSMPWAAKKPVCCRLKSSGLNLLPSSGAVIRIAVLVENDWCAIVGIKCNTP